MKCSLYFYFPFSVLTSISLVISVVAREMSSGRGLVNSHKDRTGKTKLSTSLTRPSSAGAVNTSNARTSSPSSKTRRKGSPIMHKLAALFRRNPDHEEGVVPVRPSCFDDDRYNQRRSESPEAPDGGKRRNSNSTAKQFKIRKPKEKQTTRMWRPKVFFFFFFFLNKRASTQS